MTPYDPDRNLASPDAWKQFVDEENGKMESLRVPHRWLDFHHPVWPNGWRYCDSISRCSERIIELTVTGYGPLWSLMCAGGHRFETREAVILWGNEDTFRRMYGVDPLTMRRV